MAVSDSYREYALEQLGRVIPVTAWAMFGGVGIYGEALDHQGAFNHDHPGPGCDCAASLSPRRMPTVGRGQPLVLLVTGWVGDLDVDDDISRHVGTRPGSVEWSLRHPLARATRRPVMRAARFPNNWGLQGIVWVPGRVSWTRLRRGTLGTAPPPALDRRERRGRRGLAAPATGSRSRDPSISPRWSLPPPTTPDSMGTTERRGITRKPSASSASSAVGTGGGGGPAALATVSVSGPYPSAGWASDL